MESMTKFLERLVTQYPDTDKYALERIIWKLKQDTFPQLNDQTKVSPTKYLMITVGEIGNQAIYNRPPDEDNSIITRRKGVINRLRRIYGELTNKSMLACGGWNIAPRRSPMIEKTLEIKSYGIIEPPYRTRLACVYCPQQDRLYVYRCETTSFV